MLSGFIAERALLQPHCQTERNPSDWSAEASPSTAMLMRGRLSYERKPRRPITGSTLDGLLEWLSVACPRLFSYSGNVSLLDTAGRASGFSVQCRVNRSCSPPVYWTATPDHSQAAELGKIVDQGFTDAVSKVIGIG
jgi:hypothetical protein